MRQRSKPPPESSSTESDSRYRVLFEAANDAIFIMQGERFVDCNAKTLALFGCTRRQIIGETPFRFSPRFQPDGAESRSAGPKKIEAALEGKSQRFEWTHRKYDGTLFEAEVSLNVVSIGGESFLQAIVRDISERKKAEVERFQNERFLEAIFDSIQDGISVLNTNLDILRTNRTMRAMYSHMVPLEGKKCFTAYQGRPDPCPVCPTSRAMKSGKLEMDEVPLHRDDGETLTLEVYAFPMFDASGSVVSVIEYVRDITARKETERLLTERQQLYHGLFENNTSVMLLIDPETGEIVDANRAATAYYGYSRSRLQAMRISDINILTNEEIFSEMQQAKTEKRNVFYFQHRLSSGEIRQVEVYSGPVTIGDQSRLCSIVHDISERKMAEKEKEALIAQLQKALSEVKTLRGFLPICAKCKKIRDDSGYWNQIESYIRRHSQAEFSHSLCPECARKLYPFLKL